MANQYTTFFNTPIAVGDGDNISSTNEGNVVLAQRQFALNVTASTLWFQLPVRASITDIYIEVSDTTPTAGTYTILQNTSASATGATTLGTGNISTTGQRSVVAFSTVGSGRIQDISLVAGVYIGVQIAALAPAANTNVRIEYFYNTPNS